MAHQVVKFAPRWSSTSAKSCPLSNKSLAPCSDGGLFRMGFAPQLQTRTRRRCRFSRRCGTAGGRFGFAFLQGEGLALVGGGLAEAAGAGEGGAHGGGGLGIGEGADHEAQFDAAGFAVFACQSKGMQVLKPWGVDAAGGVPEQPQSLETGRAADIDANLRLGRGLGFGS